jgi:hypothetical protein
VGTRVAGGTRVGGAIVITAWTAAVGVGGASSAQPINRTKSAVIPSGAKYLVMTYTARRPDADNSVSRVATYARRNGISPFSQATNNGTAVKIEL